MSNRRLFTTAGVMNATASFEGIKTPVFWSRCSNGWAQKRRFKSLSR